MRILVPIKRTIDYNIRPQVLSDGSGVDLAHVKMAMNPFDEIALEQAVSFREAGAAEEVLAVSVGGRDCRETLLQALALGADRALLVEIEDGAASLEPQALEPLAVAKVLAAVVRREGDLSLALLGKQAIDDDCAATGQMLAGYLGWGQATFASKVVLESEPSAVRVVREIDGGLREVRVFLPAVVTVDLRLNEPRYASLPQIMRARKKPLDILSATTLGVDLRPRLEVLSVTEPPSRAPGVLVSSARELVEKLKHEAGVL